MKVVINQVIELAHYHRWPMMPIARKYAEMQPHKYLIYSIPSDTRQKMLITRSGISEDLLQSLLTVLPF